MVNQSARAVAKQVKPLSDRVRLGVCRGVVNIVDDTGGLQKIQVEAMAGDLRDGAERFQNYGFTSNHFPGAEAATLAVGGSTSHTIIVAVDDRRYRLRGLSTGEVAIYDDQGQTVILKRTGIEVTTPFDLKAMVGKDAIVTAAGNIRLDGKTVEIHAQDSLKLDCGGYGETWLPTGRNTWTDGTTTTPIGPPAPPEHP